VVFCSSDRELKEFEAYYYDDMSSKFAALPFEATQKKAQLSKILGVKGIPTLIALDRKTLEVVTKDGRACVSGGLAFPEEWYPKPYADLAVDVACKDSDINDAPALLVLCTTKEDSSAVDALKAIAEERKTTDLLFYYATSNDGPVARVRELTGTTTTTDTTVLLLDIPADGSYYKLEDKDEGITKATLEAFLDDCDHKKHPRRTLGRHQGS